VEVADQGPDSSTKETASEVSSNWRHRIRQQRKWLLGVLALAFTGAVTTLLTTALTSAPHVIKAAVNDRRAQPATTVSNSDTEPIKLIAEYNWTTASIIWTLPGLLSAEESKLIQEPLDEDPAGATNRIESVLANRDGVKVTYDSAERGTEHSQLRLIVIGQSNRPVLISGMRATIIRRERPLSGTLVFLEPQGGGSNLELGFDLDSVNPIARAFNRLENMARPYFETHHVTVKKDEQVVFAIRAFTKRYYCEWKIQLDAVIDGKKKTFTIMDGSRPFRTTALTHSYQEIYRTQSSPYRFVKQPPGSRF
jgi:hypothetical protein